LLRRLAAMIAPAFKGAAKLQIGGPRQHHFIHLPAAIACVACAISAATADKPGNAVRCRGTVACACFATSESRNSRAAGIVASEVSLQHQAQRGAAAQPTPLQRGKINSPCCG
jgi:hypothetical protein